MVTIQEWNLRIIVYNKRSFITILFVHPKSTQISTSHNHNP
jgi:hypothetical protein